MIIYKSDKTFTKKQVTFLFEAVKWESAKYPEKLFNSLIASETVLSAWHDDYLIGIMSAVSDLNMNVFFPYLLIHPDYQGKGIGKSLVKLMLQEYKEAYRKILVCDESKISFYKKCGFSLKENEFPMMVIS